MKQTAIFKILCTEKSATPEKSYEARQKSRSASIIRAVSQHEDRPQSITAGLCRVSYSFMLSGTRYPCMPHPSVGAAELILIKMRHASPFVRLIYRPVWFPLHPNRMKYIGGNNRLISLLHVTKYTPIYTNPLTRRSLSDTLKVSWGKTINCWASNRGLFFNMKMGLKPQLKAFAELLMYVVRH